MTRAEVTEVAKRQGYQGSDAGWLQRSSKKETELTLVDLTFRNGRLIAVREGRYDPHTKKVVYRTYELCK